MVAFETYPVVKLPEAIKEAELLALPKQPVLPKKQKYNSAGFGAAIITGAITMLSMFLINEHTTIFFAIIANLFGISLIWAKINSSSNKRKDENYNKELELYEGEKKRYYALCELYELKQGLLNEGYNRPVYYQSEILAALKRTDKAEKDCISTKGFTENLFFKSLQDWFPGCITIDKTIQYYAPDFIYQHKKTGLTIDIEIDEPYAAKNNRPTHYIGSDDKRDDYFLRHNWLVVRFCEQQIQEQPAYCCKFLSDLIIDLIGDVHCHGKFLHSQELSIYSPKPIKRWSFEEAKSFATNKLRQNYLGTDFNQVKDDEENELPF